MYSADDLIQRFNLEKHPEEGGFFIETYRSKDLINSSDLSAQYDGPRNISTAIYYLLTPETFSAIHRISSDEVFHFYYGDTVEMIQLFEDGSAKVHNIGRNFIEGDVPQLVVPKNVWQGTRLKQGGSVALLGCTVSPGFDYNDYEHGNRMVLLENYKSEKEWIDALTT